jgi:hypothetical protein
MKSKTYRFRFLSRIITLTLMSVYLLFSVGILRATHFCMGREASVSYFTTESKKCGCSIYAEEKSDCCDDEQDILKLDKEQKTISKLSLNVPEWMLLEKLYSEQFVAFNTTETAASFDTADSSPPDIPLFKFHCSFVFYDDEMIA